MRMILASVLLAIAWPAQASSEFHRQLIEIERNLPAQAKTLRTRAADPEVAQQLDEQSQRVRWLAEHETDAGIQRKARSLEILLEQVRHAPESLAFGAPPSLAPTILSDEQVGRSCEAAIPFELGTGRRVAMAAGESRWFRVDLLDPSLVRVSSRGSTIDASLDIHADCRIASGEPVARGDDEHGLQAEVAVPAARQTFWYARLTNEGDQAGEANIFATQTAALRGTVRSRVGDLPVQDRQIGLWRVQGQNLTPVASSFSNGAGDWTIAFVEPGTYAIRTRLNFGSPGLLDQAFSNITCGRGVDFESCGTPGNRYTTFELSNGETRIIDFRLDAGAVVTGVVRNAQTNAPIPGALIRATDSNAFGTEITTLTDGGGRYRLEGSFPGTAYLGATADGFVGQIFDGLPCPEPQCWPSPSVGTPLPTSLAQPATANFWLRESGSIRLAVTINGQPQIIPQFVLQATLLAPAGQIAATAFFVEGRAFFPSVPPGTYRLRVTSERTIPQLYENVLCTTSFCDLEFPQGTEIVVPDSGGTVNLQMDLRWRPSILGAVTDEATGLPIRDATVRLLPVGSSPGTTTQTDWAGRYRLEGVVPGTYRLHVSSPEHLDELFDNIACEDPFFANCPGATLFTITNASSDAIANFSLRRSGRIEMVVRGSTSLATGATISARLMAPTGQLIKSYSSGIGQMGAVMLPDVPPGTHLLAVSLPHHASQLYALVDCTGTGTPPAGCPLASATPITLAPGETLSGIRFNLRRNHGVVPIRVRSSVSGAPLMNVAIDIWNAAGIRVGVERTRDDGIAWVGQPSQFPFSPLSTLLSTDNQQGFIDEVYDNRACPNGPAFLGLCPLTGGTIVTIPETGTAGQLEIQLDPRDDLFANGFEL